MNRTKQSKTISKIMFLVFGIVPGILLFLIFKEVVKEFLRMFGVGQ